MAANTARRRLFLLSPSRAAPFAYRIAGQRSFSASPQAYAFVPSNARAATTTTTTAAKPSTTSTAAQRTVRPEFPAKEPPPPTKRNSSVDEAARAERNLTHGLSDQPLQTEGIAAIDWTRSYHGLGADAFTSEQQKELLAPLDPEDVEVKPDGIIYLPEIKYRRILNRAFGPGGWGLAPRGETIVTTKIVTREYGLIVQGRLVSIARGEQQYFDPDGIPTATEGCKSNALMRTCKDLGIASELWDPRFIRKFIKDLTKEVWVEHVSTKKKRKVVLRKDDTVKYPFKETSFAG